MGWQGKLLRVNLTAGTIADEPLNMDWAQQFVGQRGLGSKYLAAEMDPMVDSLDPGNKLIFATGPLTGTMAPTGGRFSVVTKGALTGTIAASNSGGYFGAELKYAGWDILIVEGRAAEPVYLFIEDDQVEILSAAEYWGRSVWDVEPAIKARHMDPQIKVASIGRAGENGVRFSSIMNDIDRAAGRTGVGAVMGSKNLKAIAVRGTKGVSANDPQAFMEAVAEARAILDPSPARIRYEAIGTLGMIDNTHNYGSLPTRNCREQQFEGTEKINAAAMRTPRLSDGKANLKTNKACFACTIACARVSQIDPTHFSVAGDAGKERYLGAQGGLEYEAAFSMGAMCGIDDMEAMTYAFYICNEQGMDPISFGVTVAAAMELFDTGAIGLEETGGVAFDFGSAEALVRGAELTGTGEGFGRDLGLGARRLCEKYGHPEFSMTVKGQEFPGYDPRAMQGMGLAYATSNRGACHIRARPFADDFQRITTDGKAVIVKDTQDQTACIDSIGVCIFSFNALQYKNFAAMLDASIPGGWTVERMVEAGERIYNLERQFNLAAGLTKADDTLPERILKEAAKSGAAKGKVLDLDKMLPEYYALRGWTPEGVPTRETLDRLGL